jgi:uncharacterized protein (TIGR03083 family)
MELSREEAAALLGAYALDALDGTERAAVERAMATFPEVGAEAETLAAAAAELGVVESVRPPSPLRQRILGAARSTARDAPARPPLVELYRRQVDELAEVLAAVPADAWGRSTVAGWTIHELTAHLVGVEAYFAGVLGIEGFTPPPGTEHDHVAMTVPVIDAHRALRPADTREAWERGARSVVAHLEASDPARRGRVDLYGLPVSTRTALVARMFELWTHADDVRAVLGRPLVAPDAERLSVMTPVAARSLPTGMTLAGVARPGRTARLVLVGPGGGTWTVPLALGEEAGEPEITVIADAVDFCRLAATRLDPGELEHEVEGDPHLAHDLLVGARVFAA